jgi:hypothetical protein
MQNIAIYQLESNWINLKQDQLSNEDLPQARLNKKVNSSNKASKHKSTRETQDLIPRFRFIKNHTSSLRGSQRAGSHSTLSSLKWSQRPTLS